MMHFSHFLMLSINVLTIFAATDNPTPTYPTTEPRLPCNNHECTEDGYFVEGPCEDTFCQCVGGQGFLHHCQEGTFYDPVEEVCNWPWNIPSCGTTLEPTSTVQTECTYECSEENGLFPEGCCEEIYCQCFHGEGFLQQCPEGSVFNAEEGYCDDRDNVECCEDLGGSFI